MSDASGLIGKTLGNFKIVSVLGTGGMGVVYAAEHVSIGKKAAVKVLLPKFSQNADIVQRFFNEARTAATLQHPGIVDVFDFGKLESGEAYLVMDFLQGESLTDRLKRDGVVKVPELVAIARQVAAAVGAAHGKGIVHRDLKPDNVYLEPDTAMPFGVRAKVIDFGIAKLADAEGATGPGKTQAGELLGTPFYMSPEQCKGAGDVDGRSDVYALGCIVYQMAAGTVPFDAQGTGALIAAHIYEQPPPIRTVNSDVPEWLERVVMKALEKDPAKRQQTMAELAAELEAPAAAELAGGPSPSPSPTTSTSTSTSTGSGSGGMRRVIGISIAGLVVGAIALMLVTRGSGQKLAKVEPADAGAVAVAAAPADAAPPDAAPVPATSPAEYKAGCEQGKSEDCVRLGLVTEAGDGVERDLTRAFALYLQACDKKHADGCALLASMYEDGKGVTTDTSKAIALYTRACDAGSGLGCTGIATLTAMGQGLPADPGKALVLFEKACEKGEPVGCLRAGRALQRGVGTMSEPARAQAIFARLDAELPARCQAGEARACDVLGIVRVVGVGQPAQPTAVNLIVQACTLGYARACAEAATLVSMSADNDATTRALVEKSCDQGDDLGCTLLGQLLVKANDADKAVAAFERACTGGGESGCDDLARLYDAGQLVGEDKGKATQLFRKACDGGSFGGCLALGSRLGDGVGARKDERRARVVAEKACAIEPSACWMQAHYLSKGIGGAPDVALAKILYGRSCEAGDENACAQAKALLEPDAGASVSESVPDAATP